MKFYIVTKCASPDFFFYFPSFIQPKLSREKA
jgi:hypothetical protein